MASSHQDFYSILHCFAVVSRWHCGLDWCFLLVINLAMSSILVKLVVKCFEVIISCWSIEKIIAVGCNSIVKPAIAAGIGLVPVVAAIISEHAQERSSCFRSYFSYWCYSSSFFCNKKQKQSYSGLFFNFISWFYLLLFSPLLPQLEDTPCRIK